MCVYTATLVRLASFKTHRRVTLVNNSPFIEQDAVTTMMTTCIHFGLWQIARGCFVRASNPQLPDGNRFARNSRIRQLHSTSRFIRSAVVLDNCFVFAPIG